MDFTQNRRVRKTINMTPLIDIIFLLVVFFLLTSEFIISEVLELNVSQKNEISSSKTSENKAIIIVLNKEKKFLISGKEHDISSLKGLIKSQLKENRQRQIILVNKDNVKIQDLVFAMDQIKSSGGTNISLTGG